MEYVGNVFGGGDFRWIQNAEGLIRQVVIATAGAAIAVAVVNNIVAGVMVMMLRRIRIGHALIIEMGKTADDGATAQIEARGSVRGSRT